MCSGGVLEESSSQCIQLCAQFFQLTRRALHGRGHACRHFLGALLQRLAGGVELGAGWSKAAKDTGAEYVSVKLDDPSFNAPVYATLVQGENGEHRLIWSR